MFNLELPYRALADLRFVAGETYNGKPILPPGGTIFQPDSADVYFPQGNDWGTARRDHYAYASAVIGALGTDEDLKKRAAVWERKFAEKVLELQARFTDGRTFGAVSENKFHACEQTVAISAADAYLLKWLVAQHPPTFTNERF